MKDKIKTLISKFKDFYSNPYGMLITMSWLLLIVCLIIKLFGGNWFELGSENSKFIQFCNYVENIKWLKISIATTISIITTIPLMCLIYNRKDWKLKHIIIYLIVMILKTILSWYSVLISTIIDLLFLIIIPIIITKNWKRPIISNLLIMVLQLTTIFIRNVSTFGNFNTNNSTIENMLIQIDYYIMLMLLFLYNFKRKEKQ